MPFVAVQLLILALQAYILGSAFKSGNRIHNLRVLAIDYDQGIVGTSLKKAYQELEGPTMLGLDWHEPEEFSSVDDVQQAVRGGNYWAGIWIYHGATERLADAVSNTTTARSYDSTKAIGYVFNQERYPTIADGDVVGNLQKLIAASRIIYNHMNGTMALANIPHENTASIAAVLDPIGYTEITIAPFSAGSRVFINTVEQVFIILLQFFFLMGFKQVMAEFDIEARLTIKYQAMMRGVIGVVYTFFGSLGVVSMLYAFRENTQWTGGQYILMWLATWLHMHVCFMIIEVAMTFLPMAVLPFFIIVFIIISVTSTILPFDISPGFYRWAFAVPSHELYSLQITIMSGGANSNINIALPVLFAWWVLFLPLATFALFYRCKKAAMGNEEMTTVAEGDR